MEFSQELLDFGFRPLSGIKVSEQWVLTMKERKYLGFRPLSGIKVSERESYYLDCCSWIEFPSPLGD